MKIHALHTGALDRMVRCHSNQHPIHFCLLRANAGSRLVGYYGNRIWPQVETTPDARALSQVACCLLGANSGSHLVGHGGNRIWPQVEGAGSAPQPRTAAAAGPKSRHGPQPLIFPVKTAILKKLLIKPYVFLPFQRRSDRHPQRIDGLHNLEEPAEIHRRPQRIDGLLNLGPKPDARGRRNKGLRRHSHRRPQRIDWIWIQA